jgi:hypothetical protein
MGNQRKSPTDGLNEPHQSRMTTSVIKQSMFKLLNSGARKEEALLKYTDLNERDIFLRYPTDKLLGVVNTPEELQATIVELNAAGFGAREISVLCGKQGADRLDVTGKDHGVFARFYRFVEKLGDTKNLAGYQRELLHGHFLLAIAAANKSKRQQALNALQSHGGHQINCFGKLVIERLAS